jgi:hypothetical protein
MGRGCSGTISVWRTSHEMSLKWRTSEKVTEHALQAKFFKKIKDEASKVNKGKD